MNRRIFHLSYFLLSSYLSTRVIVPVAGFSVTTETILCREDSVWIRVENRKEY